MGPGDWTPPRPHTSVSHEVVSEVLPTGVPRPGSSNPSPTTPVYPFTTHCSHVGPPLSQIVSLDPKRFYSSSSETFTPDFGNNWDSKKFNSCVQTVGPPLFVRRRRSSGPEALLSSTRRFVKRVGFGRVLLHRQFLGGEASRAKTQTPTRLHSLRLPSDALPPL